MDLITCSCKRSISQGNSDGNYLHRLLLSYIHIVITYSKGKDQPGKVANPARGQLDRENEFFPVPVRA